MEGEMMTKLILLLLILSGLVIQPVLALEGAYPPSRFVEASYTMEPAGIIQFGEHVWATITLTNFSKEIKESKFFFYSELDAPQWSVTVDGVQVPFEQPLVINHSAETVRITLAGVAPDIGYQKDILIARIDENTTTNDYTVITIRRTLTSKEIYEVLSAINESRNAIARANASIRNASVDVQDAEDDLRMAERYLEDANSYYLQKDLNASLAAAKNATIYANKAYERVQRLESSARMMKYALLGVVAVVIIALLIVMYKRSRWDKLR